jgi:signal transduction histidine kinase
LKSKFVLFILGILTLAVLIVGALQYFLYERERTWLVDQNIEKIASTLIASGFSIRFIDELDSADELLNSALKSDAFYHSINIFARDGELLYQNEIARHMLVPFLPQRGWSTIKSDNHDVRVLQLQADDLIIQIGIVLDSYTHRIKVGYHRILIFALVSFLILLVLSYYATTKLLRPLTGLARELDLATEQVSKREGQGLLKVETGPVWKKIVEESKGRKDEFGSLLRSLTHFFESLKNYASVVDHNNAVLSHELKTPLTVILNSLEQAHQSENPKASIQMAIDETHRMTELINSYLSWSALKAKTDMSPDLYFLKLDQEINKALDKFSEIEQTRLQKIIHSSVKTAINPLHLEQIVNNLVSNALKYTQGKVLVTLSDSKLIVQDEGAGVPATVMSRLGSPFNSGSAGGTGMGLAWVKELCDFYALKFDVQNLPSGAQFSIVFPEVD